MLARRGQDRDLVTERRIGGREGQPGVEEKLDADQEHQGGVHTDTKTGLAQHLVSRGGAVYGPEEREDGEMGEK